MRWKSKDSQYKSGEIRSHDCFMFFPTLIDGEWVWLENVKYVERFYRWQGQKGWDYLYLRKKDPFEITIIVNGKEKIWKKDTISYEELVELDFKKKGFVYSSTFYHGPDSNREGILGINQTVDVKDEMKFSIMDTSNA